MPSGNYQQCQDKCDNQPADNAAKAVRAQRLAGPSSDRRANVVGGGAQASVDGGEAIGQRGEVVSGDAAQRRGGGVEVVLGGLGGAIHGDAQEPGVKALAYVQDEGLALLDGELANGADEGGVARVGIGCEEVV